LVGKPAERLGRPKCRWEDNIEIDLREVVWGTRTRSIWLRIKRGGGVLFGSGNEHSVSIKCGEFLE
jgi:hypothetical protein